MRFNHLDHLAIAVPDTNQALLVWRDKLGFTFLYSEKVNDNTVLLTHLDLGNTQLQLVEPLVPDSPLAEAIRENGTHLHHFCLRVDNVEATKNELNETNIQTAPSLQQGTQGRKSLFISRNETNNIQVEITGS